ncbi:MAG: Lpg1974 family pore-forming outer membrane protein, partial [Chlamydiota bacterium]
ELDFLYWSAKQEGNNYAVTGTANTVPGTVNPNTGLISPTITSTGKVYSFKPTAKPGFKLTVGMNWEYDSWELFANYSYLHGSQHSSVASSSVNTGIIPLLSYAPNNSVLASSVFYTPGGAVGFVSEAKASWSFFYNNINLELAKSIPLFSYFVLHPHFGFQASWQKQHFHASYYVSSLINSSTNLGNNQAIFSQKFWGIGPRVGFDSLWQCCNHLGFFANTAFSLLYGKFHGKSTSYDTNVTAGYTHVLIAKNIYKPTTLSPVLELNLGAASEWMLYNKYLLVAHVSWDTQAWLFQNQHSTSVPDPTLLFQGLNAGIRFNF